MRSSKPLSSESRRTIASARRSLSRRSGRKRTRPDPQIGHRALSPTRAITRLMPPMRFVNSVADSCSVSPNQAVESQHGRIGAESPCTPTERIGNHQPSGVCSGAASVSAHRQRIARPGPGNGCLSSSSAGQAELGPNLAYLILIKRAERLHNPARLQQLLNPGDTVVVRLDGFGLAVPPDSMVSG